MDHNFKHGHYRSFRSTPKEQDFNSLKVPHGTEKWLQSLSTRAKVWSHKSATLQILTNFFTIEQISIVNI